MILEVNWDIVDVKIEDVYLNVKSVKKGSEFLMIETF